MAMRDGPLIDVVDLSVVIDRDEGVVRPLNGVSFRIAQGQAVAMAPWLLLPGLFVLIAVLSFNLMGDGMRDAADPYSHR